MSNKVFADYNVIKCRAPGLVLSKFGFEVFANEIIVCVGRVAVHLISDPRIRIFGRFLLFRSVVVFFYFVEIDY